MQKITPFLWFDGRIEQAVTFYTSIFPNTEIKEVSAQSATLKLEGQILILFNGGTHFKLSPAVSLFVNCETQHEIDDLHAKLIADGGVPSRCGWLTDKFGLSWQLVPPILRPLLQDKDRVKAKRVMDAMLQMGKLEIAVLQAAYDQE